jgi:hypothetical protein
VIPSDWHYTHWGLAFVVGKAILEFVQDRRLKLVSQYHDGLKSFDEILQLDDRNQIFSLEDRLTGERRRITIEDRYQMISSYELHDGVPDNVATQYDVARNLYVYAWFEYRFYNVAEVQALMALEFGLKERVGEQGLKDYIKDRKRQHLAATGKKLGLSSGMKTLIEYCRDYDLVRNEQFTAWHVQPQKQAEHAMRMEAFERMQAEGLEEIELDFSKVSVPEPSDEYDHIEHLVKYVNKIRNNYAHGSSTLHPNVLGTFEMVSEFLNSVYAKAQE